MSSPESVSASVANPVAQIRAFALDRWALANDVSFGTDAAFEFGVEWLRTEFSKRRDFGVFLPRVEEIEGEIIFAAVNYCFWEGTSANKPAGGAVQLRNIVLNARSQSPSFLGAVTLVQEIISARGYPLATDRVKHLDELIVRDDAVRAIVETVLSEDAAVNVVRTLIDAFPGFDADPFGKRALLLPQTFHRCYGLFPASIGELPVAVDYQIPKILREFGVITYSSRLASMIASDKPIERHSQLEHELRAAVMLACQRLALAAGMTEAVVDDLLWAARKTVPGPFHLTVTTDY